jgi:outer membrane receptor protein involved in Fe transport
MKHATIFTKKPLVAAIGTALASSSPVVVAQTDSSDEGLLEEIIVTSTRREASIQDIPYNISAVGGDEIVSRNILDTAELMRVVSGVSVIDRGYRNAGHVNSLIIRGVNVDNGANGDVGLSAVAPVATYIDNTPLFANFILKDVQRVEVLRGPQGTLYGSGALGGAVRYIMYKPDPTAFDANVSLGYGQTEGSDGNNMNGDFMINAPLGETAAFRLSAGTVQNDGVIDYVNLYQIQDGKPVVLNDAGQCVSVNDPGLTDTELAFNPSCYESRKDVDDVDINFGRASLRFTPTDTLDVQLNYQWQEDEIGGRRTITMGTDFDGNPYNGTDQSGSTMLEPSTRDAALASLDIEWDMGFATLTSSTSTYTHEGTGLRDNTSLWVTDRGGFANWFDILYTGNPRPVAHVAAGFDEEALVQEFRLVSNPSDGSAIDWIAGAYYMDMDREVNNFSYLLGLDEYSQACAALGATCLADGQWWVGLPLQEIDFWYIRQEEFTDLALYGEITWHASDSWHFTVGARWFDNELKNNTAIDFPLVEGTTVPFVPYPSQQEDDVQFKLNVAWDVNENTMAYGTISEGFRRGGSNAIPDTGFFAETNPTSVQSYKADTVTNYEIGVKGSTARMRYSADVYYVDWQDPQLNTATADWAFFMAQNGESAATSGLELEAQFLLTDNLDLQFGYGYVKAELTADLIQPQYGSLIATDGHRLPGTSEHTASGALTHNALFNNGWELTSRLSGYYQSDSINSVADNTLQDTFDSFSIWNVSATLGNQNWAATLYVKNLGDEQGITGNYPATYMSTDTGIFENYYGNNQRQYLATPRTIGVVLRYDF